MIVLSSVFMCSCEKPRKSTLRHTPSSKEAVWKTSIVKKTMMTTIHSGQGSTGCKYFELENGAKFYITVPFSPNELIVAFAEKDSSITYRQSSRSARYEFKQNN